MQAFGTHSKEFGTPGKVLGTHSKEFGTLSKTDLDLEQYLVLVAVEVMGKIKRPGKGVLDWSVRDHV